MQHKFPYKKGRPLITVKLKYKKNVGRYFELLLDSGADFTLISKSQALLLGLQYSKIKSKEIKVEVANLTLIHAKKAKLRLALLDDEFAIPVLVAKEEVEPLIGRKGFFEYFDVLFQERMNQIVLIKDE